MVTGEAPIAGFISPPRWYDPSPAEFASICAGPVRTQQTILPLPLFDFQLPNIAGALPEMLAAARALGETGCGVIAKTGTPFAWAGLRGEAAARDRCRMLADIAGVPVVMAGLAIVDGLRALGATRIAVSTPYYTQEWRDNWTALLLDCGFDVVLVQSMDQQGLVPADGGIEDHGWATTPHMIVSAARKIAADAPGAEAVVITGAGARTLALTAEIERGTGLPLLASDTALYWAAARGLGVPLKPSAVGALTSAG